MTEVADSVAAAPSRAPAGQQRTRRRVERRVTEEVQAYTGGQDVPLSGYGALLSAYGVSTLALAGLLWRRRSLLHRRLSTGDIALLSLATFKLSRLVTRDSITSVVRAPFARLQGQAPVPSEVNESVRGSGLRRAIGEVATCPFCIAQWAATGFVAGHLLAPRATRAVASTLAVAAAADGLQLAYTAAAKATV